MKAIWGVDELPVELDRLIDFEEERSASQIERGVGRVYSQEFCIWHRGSDYIDWWSRDQPFHDQSFLCRFYPVATANGTGSFYAIWDDGSGCPLGQMPIAIFGDEGGLHVVAENLLQLLRLLTCDVEPDVCDDRVGFLKDEDDEYYEESEDRGKYQAWLREEFSAEPVGDPNEILVAAQAKHESAFGRFVRQYDAD